MDQVQRGREWPKIQIPCHEHTLLLVFLLISTIQRWIMNERHKMG